MAGVEPADVEIGDVEALAANIRALPPICVHFSNLAAIDLNRRRANFGVAMAKAKRAGQLTLLGQTKQRFPVHQQRRGLRHSRIQRGAITRFILKRMISRRFVRLRTTDFARIDIDYVPDRFCVESKSLKFYLASYRNERAFNERLQTAFWTIS